MSTFHVTHERQCRFLGVEAQHMKTLALWKPGITSVEHWDTGADQTGTRHRRALLGVRLQEGQRRGG